MADRYRRCKAYAGVPLYIRDAQTFSPSDITSASPVMNLNAVAAQMTLISSTHISAWNDQLGSGISGTQPVDASGQRPIYSASGGPGDKPYVSFGANAGVGQWVVFGDVFSALTAAEVFVVRKAGADPAGPFPDEGGFWHFGTNANGDLLPFTDGNVYDCFGSTARKSTGNPTVALTGWHIYNVITTASEWTSNINGVEHFTTGTNTVGFAAAATLGKTLGAVGDSAITTIWMFDGKLSTEDRAAMLTWLDLEWQLGLGL